MNIINLFLVLVTLISQNENNVIEFNRDIRPIISQKCLKCHGLDDSHRKGKLRLDDRSHALKGGKSGAPAIVSGKPESSELYLRIISGSESEQMPPASKSPLHLKKKQKLKSGLNLAQTMKHIGHLGPWLNQSSQKLLIMPGPQMKLILLYYQN